MIWLLMATAVYIPFWLLTASLMLPRILPIDPRCSRHGLENFLSKSTCVRNHGVDCWGVPTRDAFWAGIALLVGILWPLLLPVTLAVGLVLRVAPKTDREREIVVQRREELARARNKELEDWSKLLDEQQGTFESAMNKFEAMKLKEHTQ